MSVFSTSSYSIKWLSFKSHIKTKAFKYLFNYISYYYLIVCRSLTYAQRTASALERAGITAHILRSPKMISGEGCSHSVKVSERNLAPALLILGRVGLTPKRIYIMSSDGSYKEVLL